MATYSGNTSLAVSATVSQTLGTYNVPANSYFIGQVSLDVGATGYAEITVGGVTAATLAATNVSPSGAAGVEIRNATIHAGPGTAIATGTVTYGGSVILTGVVLINTGP